MFRQTTDGKSKQMRMSTVLLIGYRNIAINKMRSFLTIGGVAIGIGIITFLISLGFGAQQMVINEVTKNNPTDIIDISNENLENFVTLDDDTIKKIKDLAGIEAVETKATVGGKFSNGDAQTDVIVNGVTPGYFDLAKSDFSIIQTSAKLGDFDGALVTPQLALLLGFSTPEESVGKEVSYSAVVSHDISQNNADENTGGTKEGNILISGIIKDKEKADAVYAYTLMRTLRDKLGVTAGQSGKVKISATADPQVVRSQIDQMGFVTDSIVQTVQDINSFFVVIRAILLVFGIIIMSISAMGMLNTLSVSLLQRTKEIGILKALGMKRKDIFKMFILEAVIISFTGGFFGLVGGYFMAKGFNQLLAFFARRQGIDLGNFVVMPSAFVLAIVIFVFVLGLITGLLPARRAAQIHALDALRYE